MNRTIIGTRNADSRIAATVRGGRLIEVIQVLLKPPRIPQMIGHSHIIAAYLGGGVLRVVESLSVFILVY